MTAKPKDPTAAKRQAERKARELAAGRVQWKRWVHPDDVPALTEYADLLERVEKERGINAATAHGLLAEMAELAAEERGAFLEEETL